MWHRHFWVTSFIRWEQRGQKGREQEINWPETRVCCLNGRRPQNPSRSDFIGIISRAFFIEGAWRRLGALQYCGNEAAVAAEERVYLARLIESSAVATSSTSRVRAAHLASFALYLFISYLSVCLSLFFCIYLFIFTNTPHLWNWHSTAKVAASANYRDKSPSVYYLASSASAS